MREDLVFLGDDTATALVCTVGDRDPGWPMPRFRVPAGGGGVRQYLLGCGGRGGGGESGGKAAIWPRSGLAVPLSWTAEGAIRALPANPMARGCLVTLAR